MNLVTIAHDRLCLACDNCGATCSGFICFMFSSLRTVPITGVSLHGVLTILITLFIHPHVGQTLHMQFYRLDLSCQHICISLSSQHTEKCK